MSAPLEAAGLVVRYGDREVLRGLDLRIEAGRRLALLGANGSGKSTLLRALSGGLEPTAGEVRREGEALRHRRADLLRHRQAVQLVLQDPHDQLFAADVRRDVSFGPVNLGLGEEEVRARVAEALAALEITDLADRPIHELSFGQAKRVALAGAVAMRPAVLLLDEPTAGLDPQGVTELVAALERLRAGGTTLVVATHDVDHALAWADDAAVLHDGRAVTGPPARLLGDPDLLTAARLRRPLVLDVAARLGVPPTAYGGIRDAQTLAEAVAAHDTAVGARLGEPRPLRGGSGASARPARPRSDWEA